MSEWPNRGRKRARTAREALGFTREGPLDDLLGAVEAGGVHVVVLDLPDAIAGAYLAKPDCPIALVNARHWITRQRFTLAHEFGHHRMGDDTVIERTYDVHGRPYDKHEVAANAFAGEFIVPRDAVQARPLDGVVSLEDVVLLARDYGVSTQAARIAFEGAGRLTDPQRIAALDAEIEEGLQVELAERLGLTWLQDGMSDAAARAPRVPEALNGNLLVGLLTGRLTVDQAAQHTRRTPHQVEGSLKALGLDELLPGAVLG